MLPWNEFKKNRSKIENSCKLGHFQSKPLNRRDQNFFQNNLIQDLLEIFRFSGDHVSSTIKIQLIRLFWEILVRRTLVFKYLSILGTKVGT